MNPNSRDQILSRVRSALAPLPTRAALPDWDRDLVILRDVALRGSAGTGAGPATNATPPDAWELFATRLRLVNGTPLVGPAVLAEYLSSHNFLHGYCDPALHALFAHAFAAASTAFTIETTFDRTRVDDYQFGLTAAAGAIAETGTLILSDAATSRRLGALTPWVHVAVLRRAQIHLDVPAAVASLPADPNIVWVTGPSKTADVEGILIEGVHGPGIQIALLLE